MDGDSTGDFTSTDKFNGSGEGIERASLCQGSWGHSNSPTVIEPRVRFLGHFSASEAQYAATHPPPNGSGPDSVSSDSPTVANGVQYNKNAENPSTLSQVYLPTGKSYFQEVESSLLSTNRGMVSESPAASHNLAFQTEAVLGKEERAHAIGCGGFGFEACNSFVSAAISRSAVDSAALRKNVAEDESHYVYDGGGQPAENVPTDPGRKGSEHISALPGLCTSKETPSNPCDASLLPKPEEQIGPPLHCIPAPQIPGLVADPGETPCVIPSQAYEICSSGKPAVTDDLSSSELCVACAEETDLLTVDSFDAAPTDSNCAAKRFVHGTLRYKSKCRSCKYMVVAACYLSLILLVVTLRNLRSPKEHPEEERQEDTDQPALRDKRFAGRISTVHNNMTHCDDGVHVYDENHNEIYIMSYDAFINGGWVVHVLIGMYTFSAIAAICDIYFVPALEHICEDLKLEADVAGATFMAAASSAPEFCTSVIGIFVQENDVGLGAIVGSSIFNLLAIIGLCGVFAGMPVELSWYPLSRDSIFYTVAVFEMLAFMFDTVVHWYEALVMIMTYALYILVMVYNKKIEQLANASETTPVDRASSLIHDIHKTHSARLEIIRARSHSRMSHHLHDSITRLKALGMHGDGRQSNTTMHSDITHGTPTDPKRAAVIIEDVPEEVVEHTPSLPPAVEEVEESEPAVAEYENPLEFPEGCLHRVYWVTVLPVTALHAYTIPDSRIQDSWQSRYYMIPFAMSVFYLAVYSYIMVWAMSVAAWALDIPATVTGLTVLAAGTSVPDCLSSIFVARDGYGDMAVSNAIGSNVFDILLCLGVPWLVTGFIENGHKIDSDGMWVAGSTLVVTIVYLIISLRINNWTLTPLYGAFTLVIYVIIMIFCILVELGIILGQKEIC